MKRSIAYIKEAQQDDRRERLQPHEIQTVTRHPIFGLPRSYTANRKLDLQKSGLHMCQSELSSTLQGYPKLHISPFNCQRYLKVLRKPAGKRSVNVVGFAKFSCRFCA
ncbi:hypothetical protein TWF788_008282 [Orbilia oligospora]|uniref:Uncharacterized protein n=1 Tax=Orbilia oligospora TaxID=2813651 RepID=A0A7C8KJ47_ORBOL|nr:hypothetical protein TWF788_008282 [Orbilia oligospora]